MVTVFAFADLWFWGIINCLKKKRSAKIDCGEVGLAEKSKPTAGTEKEIENSKSK